MNILDARTVVVSYAISNLICMLVITILWKQNRRRLAGLGFWLVDFMMQFIALALVALRGIVPDFLSMTVSNTMVIGGTILLLIGLEHFTGKRGSQVHNYILLVVFIVAHAYFVFVLPNPAIRNIIISLGLLVICSHAAWLMLRRVEQGMRTITRGVGQVFVGFCLVSIGRIIVDLIVPLENDFFHSNAYDTLLLITYQMLFIVLTFSLFLMVNRRLFADLEGYITVRKQAEATIASLAKFSDENPNLIVRIDGNGNVLYANPPASLLLQSLDSAVAPTGWQDWATQALASQTSQIIEIEHAGRVYACELVPIRESDYVNLYARDITERKRAEEALCESELNISEALEFNRKILDTSTIGILTYKASGQCISANEAAATVGGATVAQLLAQNFHEIPSWKKSGMYQAAITALDTGIDQSLEVCVVTTFGKDVWLSLSFSVFDSAGEQHLLVFTSDITERKRAEEALAASESQLRALFASMNDVVIVYDIDGRHLRIAPTNPASLYRPSGDMLGKTVHEILPTEQADYIASRIRETIQTGQIVSGEYSLQIAGKEIWFASSASRLSENTVIWVAHDITNLKRADEIFQMRWRLLEFAATHSLAELMQKAVDEIGGITNSPIGFCHCVEADQKTLSLQAWSTRTQEEFCRVEGKGMHYDIDQAGVWVDCVHQRKPVIHNNYAALPHRKGLPAGHAEVVRELVVPILRQEQVVFILGVGNKPSDYEDKDVELVAYIADLVWVIVERKWAEQALQASEEKHRLLFETMMQGAVFQDAQGHIFSANPAAEKILGLTLDQMRERTSIDPQWGAIHEDGSDFTGEDHPSMTALRTGEQVQNVIMGIHNPQDGERRWIIVNAVPQFKPGEEAPCQVYTMFSDITERRQAEEKLRQLSRAVEQSPASIMITDTTGNIEYVNPKFAQVTGYTYEQAIGNNPRILRSDHTPKETYRQMWAAITSGREWRGEFVNRKKNGELYYEAASISPIIDNRGVTTHYLAVKEDVTPLKISEHKLRQANQQLQVQLEQIQSLQAELREQAIRDPLTGLYNRRYLNETLERELARAVREDYPISFVMLDIDHFKKINDTFGHGTADVVLKKLATQLLAQTRIVDIVCRYGGDEFLIILPNITVAITLQIAERWRKLFMGMTMPLGYGNIQTTISCGISEFPLHGNTMEEIISSADKALYHAKATGRNRVVAWQND